MSVSISKACLKETWTTYIATILYEASLETGSNKVLASTIEKIDTTLRPILFLKLRTQAQGRLSRWATSVMTYLLQTRLRAAHESVEKTHHYMNNAVVLQSWHIHLDKIEHRLTAVSAHLQVLTQQILKIDMIRVRQAQNRLHAGRLIFLGCVTWAVGAFVPLPWISTAGKVILVASSLFYGFNGLYHYRDQTILETSYKTIETVAAAMADTLSYYNAEMKLQSERQENESPVSFLPDPSDLSEPPSQEDLDKVVYEDFGGSRDVRSED